MFEIPKPSYKLQTTEETNFIFLSQISFFLTVDF